jgi:hypothetical protein
MTSTPKANGHIHTPYSFSAFASMEQAFQMARDENLSVLGINDFNTFNGYEEFDRLSKEYKIYPLFNVEFMGLLEKEQKEGIRINDPNNPGRIYFSGKGLDFPVKLTGPAMEKFTATFNESNQQTRAMLEKASAFLQSIAPELSLNYDTVLQSFTHGMLRERHIAKAVRLLIFEKYATDNQRSEAFQKIFGGKELKSQLNNDAGIDNEIRSNLLKAGGPAYVPEDPKAFLPLDDIISIITNAGGIPCYPVLLDDPKGNYTEYEADMEKLFKALQSRNICSLELIPGRNDISHLKRFVEFFDKKGFIITFGTEHNTPELIPLTVDTRGNVPLDDYLDKVNFEGVCIIAAHQHLRRNGQPGVDTKNILSPEKRAKLIELGMKEIERRLEIRD